MAFATAVIGLGTSIAGQISQASSTADSAEATGKSQKQAYDYNASVYKQEAELIDRKTDLSVYRQRKAAKKLNSQQRASYAKAGVLLDGSPTAVLVDSAAEAEMDIMVTKYNSEIEKNKALSSADYQTYLGTQAEETGERNANAAWATAGGNIASTLLTQASNWATRSIPTKKGT
jgi:hypothetical protein